MNASMDAINLDSLDHPPDLQLDERTWRSNLASFERLDYESPLPAELSQIELPCHWRPVTALDGSPTFRIEPPAGPPTWLTGSAMPQARADALLRMDDLAGKNIALPGIGVGAELTLLLKRVAYTQGIVVFERDPLMLAAALRLCRLGPAIVGSKCILVPPGREREYLTKLLVDFPGFVPPSALIGLPFVEPEYRAHVQQVCEEVSREIVAARSKRLAELKASAAPREPRRPGPLRLALSALGPNRNDSWQGSPVHSAAEELGWEVSSASYVNPLHSGPLPIAEQFADFQADLHICVEHNAGALPISVASPICRWFTRRQSAESTSVQEGMTALASSPIIAEALKATGWPADRIFDFHWAVCRNAPTMKLECAPQSNAILLVGDLPDASADAAGITQTSHRLLWEALTQRADKVWAQDEILHPHGLLRSAEKASGIALGDAALRKQFERLIIHSLIPSLVLQRISCGLIEEGMDVWVIGNGWKQLESERLHTQAADLGVFARCQPAPVRAAVFGGSLDLLSGELMEIAVSTLPMLLHHPGRTPLHTRIGDTLRAGEHFKTFADQAELRTALATISAHGERQRERTARRREHVLENHTWAVRLRELAAHLGLAAEEN